MVKRLGEFDFIEQCLIAQAANGQSFYQHAEALGIGDDCAVLPPLPADEQMVVSTDMLVEGRHYVPDVDPRALGHKVLAVNLSDLAAMGAQPIAFTLAAALRGLNAEWLNEFLAGVLDLARETQCALIGGDTTGVPNGGPEVFSVTVMGRVPRGGALRRSGVRDGDDLWVSGALGDPAYAVSERHQDEKLLRPNPRLSLGLGLRSLAHAAIDVSDGLHSEANNNRRWRAMCIRWRILMGKSSNSPLTCVVMWQGIGRRWDRSSAKPRSAEWRFLTSTSASSTSTNYCVVMPYNTPSSTKLPSIWQMPSRGVPKN